MLRAAALSLLVLVSVAVTLPLVDSSAHNSGRSVASRRSSHLRHRHSRAWWRRYRARLRRQRAAAAKRKQSLQLAQGRNMNAPAESHNNLTPAVKSTLAASSSQNPVSSLSLPAGWVKRSASANGEMKFVISAADGQYIGGATMSLVNARAPGDTLITGRGNRKSLGGVPLTELRRTVIDKMITESGWVVNDLQREIGGKPVFIVLAQTAASNDGRTPQLTWAFFFTEVEGRIYSLASSSLQEFSDRVADDSAKMLASFLASRPAAFASASRR